jgi:Protein of unknown function (DUF2637)
VSAADRAIRVSTAAAVVGVAGIAAYVSYWHAYEVVRGHGESGVTARLEPATIDGLVYASSMVVLYAARHRLAVPALARWLLALGIVATLGANVAHGWNAGPIGAAVAAWPAASLVGSYELLLWLVRTAAGGGTTSGSGSAWAGPAGQTASGLRLVPVPDPEGHEATEEAAHPGEPCGPGMGQPCQAAARWSGPGWPGSTSEASIEAAAVACYQVSVQAGQPLSERKLAARFGKTSRRWARSRMAEARQEAAAAEGRVADPPGDRELRQADSAAGSRLSMSRP